eukprot:7391356-Prymnesium_polylepis.1
MMFHVATVGRSPAVRMKPKCSSIARRSPARAHTAISALYVSTDGVTWSARILCNTASASERWPHAAYTRMSVV